MGEQFRICWFHSFRRHQLVTLPNQTRLPSSSVISLGMPISVVVEVVGLLAVFSVFVGSVAYLCQGLEDSCWLQFAITCLQSISC